MTEKEILQKLIGFAYELQEEAFIYLLGKTERYDREFTLGYMEDYEVKDMDKYLEEYPFIKCISYGVLFGLQKYYNAEYLSAGWCGCASPERLVEVLEQELKLMKERGK